MIIVAVFLDNIDLDQTRQFRGNREPFCQTFLATFRLLKDQRMLILIPLTMYSGFEQSFLSGEYTKVRSSVEKTMQKTAPSLVKHSALNRAAADFLVNFKWSIQADKSGYYSNYVNSGY